jgi:HEAT repeat protein
MILAEKAVADEQPMVHVAALGVQAMLGRREAIQKLESSVNSLNPEEKGAALRWLAELDAATALPLLKQGLRETQPSVRGAAAMAVAEIKSGEGASLLIPLLDDPVAPVRAAAAAGLGAFPSAVAVEALKKGLRDAHPTVRAAAIGGLLEHGVVMDGLTEAVHGLVNHTDPAFRGAVARALGKARGDGLQPAIDTLQVLLNDTLPRPRIVAARSLGQIEGGESTVSRRLEILKGAIADRDDAVRATAAGAILHLLNRGSRSDHGAGRKAQVPARP